MIRDDYWPLVFYQDDKYCGIVSLAQFSYRILPVYGTLNTAIIWKRRNCSFPISINLLAPDTLHNS